MPWCFYYACLCKVLPFSSLPTASLQLIKQTQPLPLIVRCVCCWCAALLAVAGKSTVLRSLAAAALLGSVGLCTPCAPGSCLPLLDAIMLRTFSGDAPQEGLSAYGVEMREMG